MVSARMLLHSGCQDTMSQPQGWKEAVTLHLSMTWEQHRPFCTMPISRWVWENMTCELERSERWGEKVLI